MDFGTATVAQVWQAYSEMRRLNLVVFAVKGVFYLLLECSNCLLSAPIIAFGILRRTHDVLEGIWIPRPVKSGGAGAVLLS